VNVYAERPNDIPWPPIILGGAAVVAALLGWLTPLPWLPTPVSELVLALGLMLGIGALTIDVFAMLELRRNRTTIMPHKSADVLVTGGPFAFSRNPIYLGNVMLLFAFGMVFGNPWFFAIALIAGGLTQHFAILREEAHLKTKFPAGYLAYRKKVRRWI
jgi:protein-S-isoprenylcysteine O-methyltransferase Ste14